MKSGKGKGRIKLINSSSAIKKEPLPLPYIELNLSTWLKDSHGLYDYEAIESKCENQTINVTTSSKIYRHVTTMRTQVVPEDDPRQMPIQSIYIATVIIDREKQDYRVQSATVSGVLPHPLVRDEHPDLFHNSFLVTREFQKEQGIDGYPLSPGNVIRLGRVQYVVLQTRDSSKTETYKQTSHLQLNQGNHNVQASLVGSCKVCLCEESTEEDPLINPCLCKGSCQLIHVGCLKNWINSKVKKQLNDIVISYNFSKFQCEICKASFPKTVTMNDGTVIEMITIQKPDKPYIVLESVSGKEDKKQRNLHLIFSNQGTPMRVGRGHQCQMRVSDISVSRIHAEVRFQNQKFYIKDLKSKFGTLVKFKEEFTLKDKMKLQYGRVCMEFKLRTQQPKDEQKTNEDQDYY